MSESGIDSRFLMSIDISFEPPVVATPGLVVINVTGGSFEGPLLRGEMIGPSGDWARIQDNGNWKIDARLAMRTEEGDTIYCYYGGVVRMTEELAARSAAGEVLTGEDLYLRSAPNFETSSEKFAWLNDIMAVGKMTKFGGGKLGYDVYEIL
ncbi:hypothetical protein MGP2080_12125 [marine gamma proteobacterium HTCC2080]|jgi:hypothetical protein|nr:hypothetical protein MGP2080_12125 [marine gamma proteobacterium HTCC2080]MDG1064825.1 DUF3237 domain-containing protein [Luminiphilus sp.]